jgi:transcriptional regulator with XRE-family HTH domain
MKTLAKRIKALRRERGWTQQSLADMAGVHVSTVTRLELGTRKGQHIGTVRSLSKALGVTLDFLLFGVEVSR